MALNNKIYQSKKILSINLDRETESYLAEIIAQENSSSKELLKKLIYQHWQILKPRQTLAQRRDGHPKNFSQYTAPDASPRENRKQIINARITTR